MTRRALDAFAEIARLHGAYTLALSMKRTAVFSQCGADDEHKELADHRFRIASEALALAEARLEEDGMAAIRVILEELA